MPLFVRKFIVDFIETGVGALLALTFVLPSTVDDAKRIALTVAAAIIGACVSAIRRAEPDFLSWLRAKLNVSA